MTRPGPVDDREDLDIRGPIRTFLTLLAVFALFVAACGDDDDASNTATGTDEPDPVPDPDEPDSDELIDPPGHDDAEFGVDLLATGILIAGGGSEEIIEFDIPAQDAIDSMTSWLGEPDEVTPTQDPVGGGCPSEFYLYRWADLELLFLTSDGNDTFEEWVLDRRHLDSFRFGFLRDSVAVGSTIADFREAFPEWDGSVDPLFEFDDGPESPGWFGFEASIQDYESASGMLSAITSDQSDSGIVDLFWAGGECSHFVS